MSQNLQLTGGTTKRRRELDFYPTPEEVTEALIQTGLLGLQEGSSVLEPACGDGAMVRVLERHGYNVIGSDLRQDCAGIGGVDFTTLAIEDDRSFEAVVTNPPFYVAEQFITQGLKAAPVVALLFKSQFWHAKRRLALFRKHPPAYVLPLTWRPDFLQREKSSPTMEVAWTVWIRGSQHCKFFPLEKPSVN